MQAAINQANPNGQVSRFEDATSYTLGIGHRLNNRFAVRLSVFFEPGDSDNVSALAPIGATRALTAGARYSFANGTHIGGALTYITYGDANIAVPFNIYSFSDSSSTISAGISLSRNF